MAGNLIKSAQLKPEARNKFQERALVINYRRTSGSGAPTETPPNSGFVLALDIAGNKVWAYNGASWTDVTPFLLTSDGMSVEIIHPFTSTDLDSGTYNGATTTSTWKITRAAGPVFTVTTSRTVINGDAYSSFYAGYQLGTNLWTSPILYYSTANGWTIDGVKGTTTSSLAFSFSSGMLEMKLANNNLYIGSAGGLATALAPTANRVFVTDGSGVPAWTQGLPTGTTVTGPFSTGFDVPNRSYVDSIAAGFGGHLSVRVATVGVLAGTMQANNATPATGERAYNTTLKSISWFTGEGPTTIDSYTLQNGDRIMVKDETATSGPSAGEGRTYNGIYVRTSQDVWTRADDFNNDPAAEIMPGDFFPVQMGTVNTGSQWYQVAFDGTTDVLDTDIITFTQFSGSGAASLAGLSDVTITTPVTGQALIKSAGNWVNGAIDLANANAVTGTLPIAKGGTNSSTSLNNNRIMVSSGGAIVEAAALSDGQLLIGSTGNAPVAATLTAGTGISITNNAGSITIAQTATFTFADEEVPSGTKDDSNVTFTLANTPSPATSLHLYVNGVRQMSGGGNDYTLSGATITFAVAPSAGDNIVADYRY